jgi:hypothetical protein
VCVHACFAERRNARSNEADTDKKETRNKCLELHDLPAFDLVSFIHNLDPAFAPRCQIAIRRFCPSVGA